MKVLFLDIDGVVNSQATAQRHRGFVGIDPYMADLVKKIVADTDCKVVLSSSWRVWPASKATVTKQVVKLYDATRDFKGKTDRGCEIKDWLDRHPDVERYAILDDNSDFHPDQHLFKTSWPFGLTPEIAEDVTNYLNGDMEWTANTRYPTIKAAA